MQALLLSTWLDRHDAKNPLLAVRKYERYCRNAAFDGKAKEIHHQWRVRDDEVKPLRDNICCHCSRQVRHQIFVYIHVTE